MSGIECINLLAFIQFIIAFDFGLYYLDNKHVLTEIYRKYQKDLKLSVRAVLSRANRTEADLRGQVVKFLDSVMGPNKLIERFKVMKIEQDPNQKDHVLLDIHITPYFPAKSFVIQLAGHKGDNPEDAIWESEYRQE